MREQLLTARRLYRFLSSGSGHSGAPVPLLSQTLNLNQNGFWQCFLSQAIPEAALSLSFEPFKNPPRSLSNLMNRTVPHAMPVKLYQAAEEHLTPETLLHIVIWTATAMDPDLNPVPVHRAITALEEELYAAGQDTEYIELYDYFVSIRPPERALEAVNQKKLSALAALRLSMLGLHALYGDRMIQSSALRRLRACRFSDPDTLWEAVRTVAPRVDEYGFGFKRAASLRQRQSAPPRDPGDSALIDEVAAMARRALPPSAAREAHTDEGAGWYVVANWLDFCVNVNDRPRATYDGAREMGTIANGTLLYVLSAPGYKGLHVSGGVWGKIVWQGREAWVPMNLLIKLRIDEDET